MREGVDNIFTGTVRIHEHVFHELLAVIVERDVRVRLLKTCCGDQIMPRGPKIPYCLARQLGATYAAQALNAHTRAHLLKKRDERLSLSGVPQQRRHCTRAYCAGVWIFRMAIGAINRHASDLLHQLFKRQPRFRRLRHQMRLTIVLEDAPRCGC
ncbi:hypothetical protein Bealeia2_02061 (plasmid) [Candidatus Bealeia paramacronuclearis]|nr:hypothetical protein [Candidatus Bealeia paramacronuclearis]